MDELELFIDRIALHPGRVKLVPVAGEVNTYDLVWADEPRNEGTPLNAATFNKIVQAINGKGAVETGFFAGSGDKPTSSDPITIDFSFTPLVFLIANQYAQYAVIRPRIASKDLSGGSYSLTVTWGDKNISFWEGSSSSINSPQSQNYYLAIGE